MSRIAGKWIRAVEFASIFFFVCAIAFAESSEQEYFDDIRARIKAESLMLKERGFSLEALEIVLPVSAAEGISFQLALVRDVTYAVMAVCDTRCDHVDLSIDDTHGTRLAQSKEKAAAVIVTGTPTESGDFSGVVRVPGCRAEWCQVGLTVLRWQPEK